MYGNDATEYGLQMISIDSVLTRDLQFEIHHYT